MKKIKKILSVIWIIVGLLLHLSIFIIIKTKDDRSLIGFIISVIVWWIISALLLNHEVKTANKEAKEYREKFISTEIIENDKFGKVSFEKDSKTNELYCECFSLPFGNFNPSIYIIDYNDKFKTLYLKSLEEIYDNQEKILNDYYNEAKKFCDNWDEKDSDGNSISIEYIKKNLSVDDIDIFESDDEITIVINGNFEDTNILGGHTVTASINCNTKEIIYDLVG